MSLPLPAVTSLEQCADFYHTVYPYIPQLYDLPQQLLQSWSNPAELKAIYLATNPLISAFAFSMFLAPIFLLISEFNRNYSQVDRAWSILPTIYNAHFVIYAHMSGLNNTDRLDTLIAASAVWSLRLTFNYWRKGGYSVGSEDYRWELLRAYVHPAVFFVFNVLFISIAQSWLLFTVAAPSYILLLVGKFGSEQVGIDFAVPRVILGLVLLEWFADQQQWDYQSAKQKYLKTAKVPLQFDQQDLDRGFVVTGLWTYSRHPNFAAEQAIWVTLYQWSCFTSNTMYNWSGVGALGYLILFQASTWFTEKVSAKKYPQYAEYQQRVGKFLPRLSGDLPGDFSEEKETPKVEDKQVEKKEAKTKSRKK